MPKPKTYVLEDGTLGYEYQTKEYQRALKAKSRAKKKAELEEQKKRGRPRKWTEEKLNELAAEMIEFYKNNHDAFTLTSFCIEKGFTRGEFHDLYSSNYELSRAKELVKDICEERMAIQLINGNTNGAKFALATKYGWIQTSKIQQETSVTLNGSLADAIKNLSK